MQEIKQTKSAAQSYIQSKQEGLISSINDKVEQYIRSHDKVSRNDIQRALGLTARQTGCACWHLMEKGIIKVYGTKEDSETKREVECLVWNPFPEMVFPKVSDKEKLKMISELCINSKAYNEIVPYTDLPEFISSILTILNK